MALLAGSRLARNISFVNKDLLLADLMSCLADIPSRLADIPSHLADFPSRFCKLFFLCGYLDSFADFLSRSWRTSYHALRTSRHALRTSCRASGGPHVAPCGVPVALCRLTVTLFPNHSHDHENFFLLNKNFTVSMVTTQTSSRKIFSKNDTLPVLQTTSCFFNS